MLEMNFPERDKYEASEDAQLMIRVGEGDEAAFATLVEKYQHAVVGTVAKMLGSPTDAEDIAQQVFVRVWKSAERYKPKAKFTTYLFTITRNLVFNETRRKKNKLQVSMEEQGDDWGAQYADYKTASPSEESLRTELVKKVDAAIAKLPKKQRMAIVLRRYEEMPYEEIANVLGTSVSAVKSHIFRARTFLKEELKEYLES